MKPCVHCATSKAKQKNMVKLSESPKAEKPGGRIFLDLCKTRVPKDDGTEYVIGNKHMKTMVDQAMGKKGVDFKTTKSGMVELTCKFFNVMKAKGIPIRIVCLDPAGENVALEKRCESVDWAHLQPMTFEFTSRDTPQHNSPAEEGPTYICNKARAMMGADYISSEVRGRVGVEAIKNVTQLNRLVLTTLNGVTKSRDEHIYGVNPNWVKNMRRWSGHRRQRRKNWLSWNTNDVSGILR